MKIVRSVLSWLDSLPLIGVVLIGGLLAAAPFQPEPHLVEKLRMLGQGTLSRPIDIFDLLLHGTPAVLILIKVWRVVMARR